ncbi:MAG TPA: hypothetical protein VIC85_00520 [Ktedonobacterales bacterium]|jgi:hypothetical protein
MPISIRRPGVLAGALALALLVGACGRGAPTSPAGSALSTTPVASGTAGTPGSGTHAGTPTPGGGSTTTGKGDVTLTLAGGPYAAGHPISVAIHDGRGTPIYAINTHTSCTPIQLQRWDGTAWQSVGGCGGQVPHPSVVTITGETVVTLQPAQGAYAGGTWSAGTYRAELTYTTNTSQAFAAGTSAYSNTFTIS